MGSVYGALHTQTRQLVEPSRDRDQPVQPWVPGASQDSIAPRSEPRSASMEPENESRSRRHQLEVHTRKSPPEVRLQKEQIQVVTDLVACLRVRLLVWLASKYSCRPMIWC